MDLVVKPLAALRSIPEIASWQGLVDAKPVLVDAEKKASGAWDATRDAARDAAWMRPGVRP